MIWCYLYQFLLIGRCMVSARLYLLLCTGNGPTSQEPKLSNWYLIKQFGMHEVQSLLKVPTSFVNTLFILGSNGMMTCHNVCWFAFMVFYVSILMDAILTKALFPVPKKFIWFFFFKYNCRRVKGYGKYLKFISYLYN